MEDGLTPGIVRIDPDRNFAKVSVDFSVLQCLLRRQFSSSLLCSWPISVEIFMTEHLGDIPRKHRAQWCFGFTLCFSCQIALCCGLLSLVFVKYFCHWPQFVNFSVFSSVLSFAEMGQTLSEPVTQKETSACANSALKVGSSSMQGWRISILHWDDVQTWTEFPSGWTRGPSHMIHLSTWTPAVLRGSVHKGQPRLLVQGGSVLSNLPSPVRGQTPAPLSRQKSREQIRRFRQTVWGKWFVVQMKCSAMFPEPWRRHGRCSHSLAQSTRGRRCQFLRSLWWAWRQVVLVNSLVE